MISGRGGVARAVYLLASSQSVLRTKSVAVGGPRGVCVCVCVCACVCKNPFLFLFLFFFFYKRRTRLVQLHVPQTGDLDILRCLGAQVSVRRLDGFKHAGKLPSSFVVLRDVEDGTTLQRGNVLVVLLL